jgi:hypothetical protein
MNDRLLMSVLVGANVPVPAPPELVDCIDRIEVSSSADSGCGFQLVLDVGRGNPSGLVDFPQLVSGKLGPFQRMVLILTVRGRPTVLADGVITHRELNPGALPGEGRLTITGEDVGVLMDLEDKSVEYPAQDETAVAQRIILSYARYGLVPRVLPPPLIDLPLPIDRVPVQQGTDRAHLTAMAQRYGYVFYVAPGPVPLTSVGYWGPPNRVGLPSPALSAGFGAATNVERITFRHDPLAPVRVAGSVQDRLTGVDLPVRSTISRRPPLAAKPDWLVNLPNVRTVAFRESGVTAAQALARAQGIADARSDSLVATGMLDTTRYGALLNAGGLVAVRGAGWEHDGSYYVRRVTHVIEVGRRYTQHFTLSREGVGSTLPVVRP